MVCEVETHEISAALFTISEESARDYLCTEGDFGNQELLKAHAPINRAFKCLALGERFRGMPIASVREFLQRILDFFEKGLEFLVNDIPDNVQVYPEILVDESVAGSSDLFPRNRRVVYLHRFRDVLCCFADNLNISNDRVLSFCVLDEPAIVHVLG